jgi:hypothetical protein
MPPEVGGVYALVRAARYLGVPPWELARQPAAWQDLALEFEAGEAWARNYKGGH